MPLRVQQPNTFPWSGKIIPWSAALRSGPNSDTRTLADLPHGENIQVILRSGGWLYVECRLESRTPLRGYVSRELIKHVQSMDTEKVRVRRDVQADVTPHHIGLRPQQEQAPSRSTSVAFQLAQPKIIAIATDSYLKPTMYVADPLLPGGHVLGFGQDLSFTKGRTQLWGPSVGTTTLALSDKMRTLLKEFASKDTRGKARRLFDASLKPQQGVVFWIDTGLTADAEAHPNITTFVHRALSAPNSPERTEGQMRIHQALEKVGWDLSHPLILPAKGGWACSAAWCVKSCP